MNAIAKEMGMLKESRVDYFNTNTWDYICLMIDEISDICKDRFLPKIDIEFHVSILNSLLNELAEDESASTIADVYSFCVELIDFYLKKSEYLEMYECCRNLKNVKDSI